MTRFVTAGIVVLTVLVWTARPVETFSTDTHYSLTYYMARACGYTPLQAYRVASADEAVDHSEWTEPIQWNKEPLVPFPLVPFSRREQLRLLGFAVGAQMPRVRFHAFRDSRLDGTPGYTRRVADINMAISEFPKGRKYLISLSFRGKASVRPAQVGGFDVNIVIHGSTAVRGRGDLVAYRWALWKLTAPWTHRTRPPHLGKRCAFSTSSTGPFPSNHSRKTPKGPKIALGNPDRPINIAEKLPRLRLLGVRQQNPGVFLHFLQDTLPHRGYSSRGGHWFSEAIARARQLRDPTTDAPPPIDRGRLRLEPPDQPAVPRLNDPEWGFGPDLTFGATTDYLSYSKPKSLEMVGDTLEALRRFMGDVKTSQRSLPCTPGQIGPALNGLIDTAVLNGTGFRR